MVPGRINKTTVAGWCVAGALTVLGLSQLMLWAKSHYVQLAQEEGQSTLVLVAEAVDQTIGSFAPIPALIASDPLLREMLIQDRREGFTPFANEKLRLTSLSIGASEVYIMDDSGLTVASSNYRDPDSFLNRNFSYRPYFTEAMNGRSTVFHALGTTSGERGFFFSSPILDGIDIIGVLAVKVTVGSIEEDWLATGHEILIADDNGIIFMTSRDDFRYRSLLPLTQSMRDQIAQTQQFPLDAVTPIGLSAEVIGSQVEQVSINVEDDVQSFLTSSAPLEFDGWHAIVLTPIQSVQRQVLTTMLMAALAIATVLLSASIALQRRAIGQQRLQIEREQRQLLERKVSERTADLDLANTALRSEVEERRQTEQLLRKSQKELVHAGKLAALGQMSAAISHEINQPLAAIKSYAVNAAKYLGQSRIDEANSNILSISEMADRISEISFHLRNFARQPGDTLNEVSLTDVVNETLTLLGPQIRNANAVVTVAQHDQEICALGGKLRIQQVLVNIVTNALEAMHDEKEPRVEISTREFGDEVAIVVRDYGPGIPVDVIGQIFDAFHTTKVAGRGMGLGLSISHNIVSDFGGTLKAENHQDRGAVFTVLLRGSDGSDVRAIAS